MAKKKPDRDVTQHPRYHDTWLLLKKYRDVVWSLEVSIQHLKAEFQIEYDTSIEDFLDSVYLAGADLSGTDRRVPVYRKSLKWQQHQRRGGNQEAQI